MVLLLDSLLDGLNSDVQSDNLKALIQFRQLVVHQSGWRSSARADGEGDRGPGGAEGSANFAWPLRRGVFSGAGAAAAAAASPAAATAALPPPSGILAEYAASSPRFEELFQLWGESDIAVQREVVRTLTAILFCARSADTTAVCRRILRSKVGALLDSATSTIASGAQSLESPSSSRKARAAALQEQHGSSSSTTSSLTARNIAAKVASSVVSTVAAADKLALLAAIAAHASNLSRDTLSNHEMQLRLLFKQTIRLSASLDAFEAARARKQKRKQGHARSATSSASASGSTSSRSVNLRLLQASVLRVQLMFLQDTASDIKRQALDVKGFVQALLLWRASGSHASAVVTTLGRDLLSTRDLSRAMKRRLFGKMVLKYLVDLANAGDGGGLELLRLVCCDADVSVFQPSMIAYSKPVGQNAHGGVNLVVGNRVGKRSPSPGMQSLLLVLKELRAATHRGRQDIVCDIIDRFPILALPYLRTFSYSVDQPSASYVWLGAAVLATRLLRQPPHRLVPRMGGDRRDRGEHVDAAAAAAATPVDVVGVVEFDTIVPTSSKFTKNVMGKALQSGSRLVVRTALSFMVALFDRIDHVLEWSTSVTKHCVPEHSRLSEAREKLLKRVQSHVPDFSVVRSLVGKTYAPASSDKNNEKISAENRGDGEVEEEEELPSLLTVLTRYLQFLKITMRFDGSSLLKGFGLLVSPENAATDQGGGPDSMSKRNGKPLGGRASRARQDDFTFRLLSADILNVLGAAARAGMFQWCNFVKKQKAVTPAQPSILSDSSESELVLVAQRLDAVVIAAGKGGFSTPLRSVLLTCAAHPNKPTRDAARRVAAIAIEQSGGIFRVSHGETSEASCWLPSYLSPVNAVFLDSVLAAVVRDPLGPLESAPDISSTFGIFTVVAVTCVQNMLVRVSLSNSKGKVPQSDVTTLLDILLYLFHAMHAILRQPAYAVRLEENARRLTRFLRDALAKGKYVKGDDAGKVPKSVSALIDASLLSLEMPAVTIGDAMLSKKRNKKKRQSIDKVTTEKSIEMTFGVPRTKSLIKLLRNRREHKQNRSPHVLDSARATGEELVLRCNQVAPSVVELAVGLIGTHGRYNDGKQGSCAPDEYYDLLGEMAEHEDCCMPLELGVVYAVPRFSKHCRWISLGNSITSFVDTSVSYSALVESVVAVCLLPTDELDERRTSSVAIAGPLLVRVTEKRFGKNAQSQSHTLMTRSAAAARLVSGILRIVERLQGGSQDEDVIISSDILVNFFSAMAIVADVQNLEVLVNSTILSDALATKSKPWQLMLWPKLASMIRSILVSSAHSSGGSENDGVARVFVEKIVAELSRFCTEALAFAHSGTPNSSLKKLSKKRKLSSSGETDRDGLLSIGDALLDAAATLATFIPEMHRQSLVESLLAVPLLSSSSNGFRKKLLISLISTSQSTDAFSRAIEIAISTSGGLAAESCILALLCKSREQKNSPATASTLDAALLIPATFVRHCWNSLTAISPGREESSRDPARQQRAMILVECLQSGCISHTQTLWNCILESASSTELLTGGDSKALTSFWVARITPLLALLRTRASNSIQQSSKVTDILMALSQIYARAIVEDDGSLSPILTSALHILEEIDLMDIMSCDDLSRSPEKERSSFVSSDWWMELIQESLLLELSALKRRDKKNKKQKKKDNEKTSGVNSLTSLRAKFAKSALVGKLRVDNSSSTSRFSALLSFGELASLSLNKYIRAHKEAAGDGVEQFWMRALDEFCSEIDLLLEESSNCQQLDIHDVNDSKKEKKRKKKKKKKKESGTTEAGAKNTGNIDPPLMDSLLRAVLKFRLDNPDLLGSLQSLVSITSKAINTIASTSANGKSSVSSDATENDGETKATSSPSFFSADACVFLKTDPREIQSMIISHSRFDTIMYRDAMGDVEDRFTDTHRIAIVRLLQSLTDSSLTLLSSESTEESSILKMNAQAKLLGSLMPAYSATLSKLDRCILSIVQQEQNAMAFASDSPSTSNSSSGSGDSRTRNLMLSLDACVWGEAARLRRGLLSGEERGEGDSGGAHLSLHERYDEWFFGRPHAQTSNDGASQGGTGIKAGTKTYGLDPDLVSRTAETFPVFRKMADLLSESEKDYSLMGSAEDHPSMYDPAYILPAMRRILSASPVRLVDLFRQRGRRQNIPNGKSDTHSHYTHSAVSMVVAATTSACEDIRRHAFDILCRVSDLLAQEPEIKPLFNLSGTSTSLGAPDASAKDPFPHRKQVGLLLRCLRNALTDANENENENENLSIAASAKLENQKEIASVQKRQRSASDFGSSSESSDSDGSDSDSNDDSRTSNVLPPSPPPRVPGVIASFVLEALRVLQRPGHALYLPLNRFLLSRPQLDLEDIPMWYQCFNSASAKASGGTVKDSSEFNNNKLLSRKRVALAIGGEDSSRNGNKSDIFNSAAGAGVGSGSGSPERQWILKVLLGGVSQSIDDTDLSVCARRHVMGTVLAFHASLLASRADKTAQRQIIQIVRKAAKQPLLARLLCSSGLVPWTQHLPNSLAETRCSWSMLGIAAEILSDVVSLCEQDLQHLRNVQNEHVLPRTDKLEETSATEEAKEVVNESESDGQEQGADDGIMSLNSIRLQLSSAAVAATALFRQAQRALLEHHDDVVSAEAHIEHHVLKLATTLVHIHDLSNTRLFLRSAPLLFLEASDVIGLFRIGYKSVAMRLCMALSAPKGQIMALQSFGNSKSKEGVDGNAVRSSAGSFRPEDWEAIIVLGLDYMLECTPPGYFIPPDSEQQVDDSVVSAAALESSIDDDNICFTWLKWFCNQITDSAQLLRSLRSGSSSIANRCVSLYSLPSVGFRGALLTPNHCHYLNGILLSLIPDTDCRSLSQMMFGNLAAESLEEVQGLDDGVGATRLPVTPFEIECTSLFLREKLAGETPSQTLHAIASAEDVWPKQAVHSPLLDALKSASSSHDLSSEEAMRADERKEGKNAFVGAKRKKNRMELETKKERKKRKKMKRHGKDGIRG